MSLEDNVNKSIKKAQGFEDAVVNEIFNKYSYIRIFIRNELAKLYEKFSDDKTGYLNIDDLKRKKTVYNNKSINQLEKLDKVLESFLKRELKEIDSTIDNATLSQYLNVFSRMDWALQQETGLDLGITFPSPEQVKASVYTDLSKLSDKTLLDIENNIEINRIQKSIKQALSEVKENAVYGIIKGSSYKNVALAVNKVLGFEGATAVSKGELWKAERIVRTEMHTALNNAQVDLYDNAEKKGVILKRRLRAVLDTRTRPQSVEDNGKYADENGFFHYSNGEVVRSPGEITDPAIRINDREYVQPIIEGYEPELKRIRDVKTGKNKLIPSSSYEEWINSTDKKEILKQIKTKLPEKLFKYLDK